MPGRAAIWSLLEPFADLIGLALLAGTVTFVAGILHHWYTRTQIPEGLSVLFGLSVVAVYLNAIGGLGSIISSDPTTTELLALNTVIGNVVTFAVAGTVAAAGGRMGDLVGQSTIDITAGRSVEGDVSGIVKAVGRVITVDLPDEIEDIDGYDPVDDETKEKFRGRTLLFPRRLTVNELRERLVDRLQSDYGVGHVDVDLTEDGTVEYLAVGSRAAGLGPTLPPETVALAVRADPAYTASPGDLIQLWRPTADGPKRVVSGKLRGTAGDVVTVSIDRAEADTLDDETRYRLVTLPVEPRCDREFASLLRAAPETMAAVSLAEGSLLVGRTVDDLDASVVAIRTAAGVEPIPAGDRALEAGETLYAIARPDRLRKLDADARPARSATDND